MKLITVKVTGEDLIETECEICHWSTDSSVGDAIREVVIHIIAEHSRELTPRLTYLLLRNT